MVDPFSLGALGALAATEGIKFLYGQAGEVLTRWRERKKGNEEAAEAPIPVPGTELLEGELEPPKVDFEAAERLHEDIEQLATVLAPYTGGISEPAPDDTELSVAADGLRRALEAVYGQRITFKGEDRAASGPTVIGRAEVETVAGDVAGVRARLVTSGRIKGTATAKRVEKDGELSGVKIDTVGQEVSAAPDEDDRP
jgi:hypothetical protein